MKYSCKIINDTTVEIRKGDKGSLTFGVGGPVAGLAIKDLCADLSRLAARVAELEGYIDQHNAAVLSDDNPVAALTAKNEALRTAMERVRDELNLEADHAEEVHRKQEAAFDEWLRTRKGGKPIPAVGLPIAAGYMRKAAKDLAAALLGKD